MSVIRQIILAVLLIAAAHAAVPALLHHQGRMAVNGVNFNGEGLFKFALVNGDGSVTYWSNDGTGSGSTPPATAVRIAVSKGHYSVLLGDVSLAGMSALPPAVFDAPQEIWLRVWFNDGTLGFQQISPDQRLVSTPYAMVASKVDRVLLSDLLAAPMKPVIAWGSNASGQINVPALADITAISAGATQNLALKSDGTVVSWGSSSPALPAGLNNIIRIASGTSHHLAIRSNGTLVAWGSNSYGQTTLPGGVTTAKRVAAGEKHSLALLQNGSLLAWGDNTFQQTSIPAGLADVTAIAAGADHNLALKSDGTVVAWGRNEVGQCNVPAGLTNITAIAAGAHHSLAVKNDGTVIAWGWDSGGQSTVPANLIGVTAVAGGYASSVALKSDGTVVVFGDNSRLQNLVPAEAVNVAAIAAGAEHLLALRSALVPVRLARTDTDTVFSGRLGVRRTPSLNALEVEGDASKSTAGAWLANSDRRIKNSIEPVEGALEKLAKVRLVDFRYTPEYLAQHPGILDRRYLNVIAQEFAEIFPDHVHSSGELMPDGSPVLQVDTYPLTIYSAAAVQELHRENRVLKEQMEPLKKQLHQQEERLKRLESALTKSP
jgi:hypothetical protein